MLKARLKSMGGILKNLPAQYAIKGWDYKVNSIVVLKEVLHAWLYVWIAQVIHWKSMRVYGNSISRFFLTLILMRRLNLILMDLYMIWMKVALNAVTQWNGVDFPTKLKSLMMFGNVKIVILNFAIIA